MRKRIFDYERFSGKGMSEIKRDQGELLSFFRNCWGF